MPDWTRGHPTAPGEASAQALLHAAFSRRAQAERLLALAIERTADTLPLFDRARFAALARSLSVLATCLEGRSLLALELELGRAEAAEAWLRRIERLIGEERSDAAAALELREALLYALDLGEVRDVGGLAYLMRAVAENRARHLAWAQEVLTARFAAPTADLAPFSSRLRPYETVSDRLLALTGEL